MNRNEIKQHIENIFNSDDEIVSDYGNFTVNVKEPKIIDYLDKNDNFKSKMIDMELVSSKEGKLSNFASTDVKDDIQDYADNFRFALKTAH